MGSSASTSRERDIPLENRKQIAVPKPDWKRVDYCVWMSVNGAIVKLTDVGLNNLTRLEINILQGIIYDEIDSLITDKSISDAVKEVFEKLRFPSKKPKNNGKHQKRTSSNVFGKNLEACLASDREKYAESIDQDIPRLVYCSIDYLEKHALHAVGIFRISSSYNRVKEMRNRIEDDCHAAINQARSPHDIALLFKEFFRELPEPLICQNLYFAFIKSNEIDEIYVRLKIMAYLISFLPPIHYNTLLALLKFLSRVASFSDDTFDPDGSVHFYGNRMNAKNLAIIFAPNILRNGSPHKGVNKDKQYTKEINIMVDLIENYQKLFCIPAELLDRIYTKMIVTDTENLNLLFMCRKMEINQAAKGDNTLDDIKPMKLLKPVELRKKNLIVDTQTISSIDECGQSTSNASQGGSEKLKSSTSSKT